MIYIKPFREEAISLSLSRFPDSQIISQRVTATDNNHGIFAVLNDKASSLSALIGLEMYFGAFEVRFLPSMGC
jgi:hypothetical protein